MELGRSYLLKKPKRPRRKRGLLYILIAFMLLVLAVVFSVRIISTFNSFHNDAEWAQGLRLQGSGNEVIYLLYGVDYWGASPYVERLVLLHHDTLTGAVTLIYIPGNTMVELDERDPEPLGQLFRRMPNPAFIELVQEIAGLPVHHYIELNYEGIVVMADYLGEIPTGVLPVGVAESLLPPGKENLNGFELYRYFLTADYSELPWEHLNRQRSALLQLWNKLENRKAWHWPRLINLMEPYVETDLSWRELGELRLLFQEYTYSSMKSAVLPGKEEIKDGCLFWVSDPDAVADMIRMVNEGYLVLPAEVRVEVLNGSGISGLAAEISDLLGKEGFKVVNTANADHFDYEDTQVIALGEEIGKARAVALFVPGAVMMHRHDPEARVDVVVIVGRNYLQYQRSE
jgi:polyisoprenyl-teichoic acid--peptidoglycan teichoic acid transferase